ncbi:hypothetical protein [Litoribrevibacter albus]|uniref:Preprotein translocase subunit SecA n=1 Tax=Litoribrevibacter albus TaxID=1473156 RepID=A0AA37SDD9_9GAMM|nr:hypothetical protein [Litoribrevibacter albus]GLQ32387.1 hypothetical protein GCM10007876_28660 [Litoribrevibacter albus]
MSEHIHLEKFKESSTTDRRFVAWDVIMILVLFSNLSFLVIDWLLTWSTLSSFWQSMSGEAYQWYLDVISANFVWIDGAFVSFFLAEFCIRWTISLKRKEYPGVFFFPLFHWYDLLGCIPLAEFRWLRLLRVISVLLRLHRMGVVNLKDNYFYRRFVKYHDILVEEVSDKVVLNVLDGMKAEFDQDYPLGKKIMENVFLPNKAELIRWISAGIEDFIADHYQQNKARIEQNIRDRVETAVESQSELKTLEKLPVVGDKISQEIQRVVSDVVWQVMDGLISDIATDGKEPDMDSIIDAVLSTFSEENPRLHQLTRNMSIQTIEVVKEKVAVKNWRQI